MNIPESIRAFIRNRLELENFCLPHFYPTVDSFEEFQAGYRTHARTGEEITGSSEGDFQKNWFVICSSYDSSPFFIDIDQKNEGFPIYFAWAGAGKWSAIEVARSVYEFSNFLELLKGFESSKTDVQDRVMESFDLDNRFWNEVWQEYEGFGDE